MMYTAGGGGGPKKQTKETMLREFCPWQGGRGPENTKILRTSYLEARLIRWSMSIKLLKCYSCSIIGPDSSASDDDKPERKEINTVEPIEKENVSLSTEFKRNAVITRADGKSQVKQCFGFCTTDFRTSFAYESAEQKPKHWITWDIYQLWW